MPQRRFYLALKGHVILKAKEFSSLNLSKQLLKALNEIGFLEMTQIQAACIPALLSNQDLIGQSETGSGKTAAFAIPVLQKLKGYEAFPQALILCPTRELCDQIMQECRKFAKYLESLKMVSLVGGQPIPQQLEALKKGAQLIIGTPGRTLELIKNGKVDVSKLKILVLDEADRLLEEGFAEEMKALLEKLPQSRQTVFFSATFPKGIAELSRKYQKNPKKVVIESSLNKSQMSESYIYEAEQDQKKQALLEVLRNHESSSTLIFCRTKATVDDLGKLFSELKVSAEVLHADLSQATRDRTTALFRNGSIRILVATDVAARGLDHDLLELVVNFDFPATSDIYIHRAGRVGRQGQGSKVVSLVSAFELPALEVVEKLSGQTFLRKNWQLSSGNLLDPKFQETLFKTIQLAAGRHDKISAAEVIECLKKEPEALLASDLGRIEIQENVTYIAIKPLAAKKALDKLIGSKFKISLKKNNEFLRLI